MNTRLNKYKYPGAKRLMLEAQEMKDSTEDYCAQPIDDNLFEWHFTVRGPPDTAFDGGYYHGRLSFPTEYPMKPPSIILLTPNGRFETNKKICLSISGYHPETWQPSWSVRTALLALIAFMPTKANRAIGSLDFSDIERRKLAQKSKTWRCDTCGLIKDLLIHPDSPKSDPENQQECSRPSTSRVCEETKFESANLKNETSNNSNDNEQSDSINNIEGPETRTSIYDNSSSQRLIDTRISGPQSADGPILVQHTSGGQAVQQMSLNEHEPHRAYPPLVLKSIFLLLSLLILRRVVMVIQA